MSPQPSGIAAQADAMDQRDHLASGLRRQINKVFPTHWSFLLGEIALYPFVVLLITGVYLTLFFEPSTTEVDSPEHAGHRHCDPGQHLSDSSRDQWQPRLRVWRQRASRWTVVLTIDTRTNTVTDSVALYNEPPVVSPNGTRRYVAGYMTVSVVNNQTGAVIDTVDIPNCDSCGYGYDGVQELVVSPDGSRVYARHTYAAGSIPDTSRRR